MTTVIGVLSSMFIAWCVGWMFGYRAGIHDGWIRTKKEIGKCE